MSDVSRDTMLLTTPFHSRVEAMCDLNDWGNWMGYTTPNAYFDVELEYFAVRSTTGVFDLSPMNKYRVTGPDAQQYLDRLITRDVSKIGVDRVGYAIWCDDNGQVMDDGTIFRLGEQDYRICSYQRADDWLAWNTLGFDVTIENESEAVAGLAVQGPTSCTVLTLLGCTDLNQLKPFGIAHYSFEGRPLMVSRTGFTGDLGYEVWVPPESAEALWDQLFELGATTSLNPLARMRWSLRGSRRVFCRPTSISCPPKKSSVSGAPAVPSNWDWDGSWTLKSPSLTAARRYSKSRKRALVIALPCWMSRATNLPSTPSFSRATSR